MRFSHFLSFRFRCGIYFTGKSLSEALIFESTNPQYDDRLFIELQVQYMKIPSSNLGRTCCVQKLFLTFRTILVHNMFSPCSAKIRASDKDLSVQKQCMAKLEVTGRPVSNQHLSLKHTNAKNAIQVNNFQKKVSFVHHLIKTFEREFYTFLKP